MFRSSLPLHSILCHCENISKFNLSSQFLNTLRSRSAIPLSACPYRLSAVFPRVLSIDDRTDLRSRYSPSISDVFMASDVNSSTIASLSVDLARC